MNKKYLDLNWWWEALMPRARGLWAQIGFKPRVIDKVIEGVPCKFFISSPVAQAWYGDQRSADSIEMRFVRDRMLMPGAKVVECGAHHAYGTIVLSKWVGEQGKVYACEPLPENVPVIQENIKLNSLTNVEVIPEAIGAQSGSVRFRPNSNGNVQPDGVPGGIEVRVTTIDELCERYGFTPDLIKIDVEGYEVGVLEGAKQTLSRHPGLQIEVHPHQIVNFNRTVEDLWKLIDLPAYEIWYQPHDLSAVEKIAGAIPINRRSHIYLIPRPAAIAA